MSIELIISIISLILTTVFNTEMDTIIEYRNNPYGSKRLPGFIKPLSRFFIKWSWWWEYRDAQGLGKLNPFRDGWHFVKGSRVYFILVLFSLSLTNEFNLSPYYSYLLAVPMYLVQGIFFELFYEN